MFFLPFKLVKQDHTAIDEAIDGLFGAPGGAELDVVAVACTHFPLLAEELQAAAPRQCLWLDSGEAIARRVRHLLGDRHDPDVAEAETVGDRPIRDGHHPIARPLDQHRAQRIIGGRRHFSTWFTQYRPQCSALFEDRHHRDIPPPL